MEKWAASLLIGWEFKFNQLRNSCQFPNKVTSMLNRRFTTYVTLTIFTLSTLCGFCESEQISGKITIGNRLGALNNLNVNLRINDSTVTTLHPDSNGYFAFTGLKNGVYNIVLSHIGIESAFIDSLVVSSNATIHLDLNYPFPCRFSKGR